VKAPTSGSENYRTASVGRARVQALEEEPAGGARIIRFLDRLELSPELQEEPGELWPAAEVK